MVHGLDQRRVPVVEAIQRYLAEGAIRFHTPYHRGGRGLGGDLRTLVGEGPGRVDLTEVAGLDDLHAPAGAIREAEALAADAFGADESIFLVNGASAGVMAMVMACCRPGDLVVIARNCHRSAVAGAVLAGARAAFARAEVDEGLVLPVGVEPSSVEAVLEANPEARAVLVTSP